MKKTRRQMRIILGKYWIDTRFGLGWVLFDLTRESPMFGFGIVSQRLLLRQITVNWTTGGNKCKEMIRFMGRRF